MRFFKKYKFWTKRPDIQVPLRITKFKRSKWKKIKKIIDLKRKFFNFTKHHNFLYKRDKIIWKRLKFRYKNNLLLKLKYRCRFDFSIPLKQTKFFKEKSDALADTLIKFEYKLDVLLWKIKLFKSTFEARQFIQKGYLLINNKMITCTQKYLIEGDILHLKNFNHGLNNFYRKKEIKSSFLEMDYYTNTFIIIKSLDRLSRQDISCIVQDMSFINQINKKVLKK